MIRRPMLAGPVEDATKLPFPMIASPKIDGIRALTLGGKLLSRSLKAIPNRHVRETLERVCGDNVLDGELISGETFQDCTSAIMSREGEPDFVFWCFDHLGEGPNVRYVDRIHMLEGIVERIGDTRVQTVPTLRIENAEELAAYEEDVLARGFEGVMLRRPDGPYKEGRSTLREGWLLKLKRFEDSEAIVVGFEELMRNENEAKTNELGLTKRSSAKAGKVPAGTLGALICRTVAGIEFNVGAGFTEAQRAELWATREFLLGALARYKHQPHGAKDAPRLPIFQGIRSPEDT